VVETGAAFGHYCVSIAEDAGPQRARGYDIRLAMSEVERVDLTLAGWTLETVRAVGVGC
jgi:hypothetical protein